MERKEAVLLVRNAIDFFNEKGRLPLATDGVQQEQIPMRLAPPSSAIPNNHEVPGELHRRQQQFCRSLISSFLFSD
jgi:hypothetical protein